MAEDTTGLGGGLWAAADLVTPMAIRVAATLRLADHIAAGTQTTEALAAAVDADRDALGRLLGHLVSAGVMSRAGAGSYSLTALGEHLRDDDPEGVRPWIDLEGAVGRAELCFVELLHTVRTGEPAFPRQFGRAFWDDLSADPRRAASFDALMGARLVADAPAIAAAYPWGTLDHVVDVGGGNARLLIAILRAHDNLRGTVIDLAGTGHPCRRSDHLSRPWPPGRHPGRQLLRCPSRRCGLFMLSGVLHNWDDQDAVRILQRCADAASQKGKVFVVDHISDAQDGTPDTEGDLRMLCYFRGRERNLDHSANWPSQPACRSARSCQPARARSSSCAHLTEPWIRGRSGRPISASDSGAAGVAGPVQGPADAPYHANAQAPDSARRCNARVTVWSRCWRRRPRSRPGAGSVIVDVVNDPTSGSRSRADPHPMRLHAWIPGPELEILEPLRSPPGRSLPRLRQR